jgi:lipopolysaccharide transport system ATP-binding protein
MSSDVVVDARGICKLYRLYANPQERLKHMVLARLGKSYGQPFWALRETSFQVRRGETFGVIGRNGSGKSTLLQILAGILTPSQGAVQVNGRIAALLELGSGFNPEFTGRENVLHYGSILGIPRAEMLAHLDSILAFADIDKFVDQPVKTYSSGMFVRLAFAAAAGVEADLLLIDEALAVGDIFFRQKCYQRLDQMRERGVAVILVSHSMNEVEQFCDRALLLHDSQPVFIGSAVEAVKRYYFLEQGSPPVIEPDEPFAGAAAHPEHAPADNFWPEPAANIDLSAVAIIEQAQARCISFSMCDRAGSPCAAFQQGETASFFYEFEILRDIEVPTGGVEFINEKGLIVHGKNTLLYGTPAPTAVPAGSRIRFRQDVALNLAVGEYTLNVGVGALPRRDFEKKSVLPHPELVARAVVLAILPGAARFSVLYRRKYDPVQLTHFGVADLPGSAQITLLPPSQDAKQP